MSTQTIISILETPAVRHRVAPLTVAQYHQLGELGLVAENTELLRGVVIKKMSKSPLHTFIVELLMAWLSAALPDDVYARQEQPLTLADSEPEPDVAIVPGSSEDYAAAHPATAKFVVEVALRSLEVDRAKAALYAEAGVSEYWLVNVDARVVEVYTEPSGDSYQATRQHSITDGPLNVGVLPNLSIDPHELFAKVQ